MTKCAFTLAEVLITLGVIGVVAAMVLPGVIKNYQTKALETAFKKSYANLVNAYNLTKSELGITNLKGTYAVAQGSRYPRAEEFYQEFYKHIKVVDKYKGTVQHFSSNYVSFTVYPIKNYAGTTIVDTCSGGNCVAPVYILSDNSSIQTYINSNAILFVVDTNGPYNGPNRYGFDVFQFRVNDSSDKIKTNEFLSSLENGVCSKDEQTGMGLYCGYYAVTDVNPDDNTKRYWSNLPW